MVGRHIRRSCLEDQGPSKVSDSTYPGSISKPARGEKQIRDKLKISIRYQTRIYTGSVSGIQACGAKGGL